MEMRAVAFVAGAAAGATAAALGCGASVGWAVAGATAEGVGDGVGVALIEAVVRTFVEVTASLAGERLTAAAAMASKRTTQTDIRISRPRLMNSYPLAGSQKTVERKEGERGLPPGPRRSGAYRLR